jgi:hypothetical protein
MTSLSEDEICYSITCGVCGRTEDARVLVPRLSQAYLHELSTDGDMDLIRLLVRNAGSLRGWYTYGDMHNLCPGCSVQLRHGF